MSIAYTPAAGGIAARAIAARDEMALPVVALLKKASSHLAKASNAAQAFEAGRMFSDAYDASKKLGRLAKAKQVADETLAEIHRAQADALEGEAAVKRILADEYDAAQERGEAAKVGQPSIVPDGNNKPATAAEIGLSRKDIHDARQFRDAEVSDPGIVRRTLDAKLAAGEEPTKAALREAVVEAAMQGIRGEQSPSRKNPHYKAPTKAGEAWTHLYGTCRALAEWATDDNILLALHGRAERVDDQSRNIAAIRKAAEILNQFIGDMHAH